MLLYLKFFNNRFKVFNNRKYEKAKICLILEIINNLAIQKKTEDHRYADKRADFWFASLFLYFENSCRAAAPPIFNLRRRRSCATAQYDAHAYTFALY